MKEESQLILRKENLDYCLKDFEKYLIKRFNFEELLDFSISGELNNIKIRHIVWKMNLELLPKNNNFEEWMTINEFHRSVYESFCQNTKKIKSFQVDPLSPENKHKETNDSWNIIYEENKLKKIINLDISRTNQEYSLFHQENIQTMMFNILFIWSKENNSISYKQGFNEILALLIMALYPLYFPNEKKRR